MAWEYEGLFDVLPQESGTLLDSFWRNEATAARIGSMAYRTRTTKAGTRLEAEVYPIFGKSQEREVRAAKERMTPERQQQLNTRRSKRRLVLLLENNFRADEDVHVTLTYAGEEPELARVRKDVRNFLNRVKRLREKRGLPELKYIYAIGHDQGHRAHVHVVMNGGISRDEIEKNWRTGRGSGRGVANTYRLQEYGSGLQGMASYLYRQNEKARDNGERQGAHMWCASRNLKKPKERTSDTKMSCRKVRLIATNFGHMAKEITEKVYPGYTLEDCRVLFSDIVDGVYIRCVMRKKEDEHGRRKTGVQKVPAVHQGTIPENK